MKKPEQFGGWVCKCEVCGHEWKSITPSNRPPTRCAKCKSPYWDRPKGEVNAAD